MINAPEILLIYKSKMMGLHWNESRGFYGIMASLFFKSLVLWVYQFGLKLKLEKDKRLRLNVKQ